MTHIYHSDAEIDVIGLGLLGCTLPKSEWTHAAHLAAAAWLLTARLDIDAHRDMPDIIRRFNTSTGVANTETGGYHETITQASLLAVRAFLDEQGEDTPLHVACTRLLVSPYGDKSWLLRHWSPAVLFAKEARREWVEPDLAPLSFAAEAWPRQRATM